MTVNLVERRLKLAKVAPEILDAFRDNKMTLDCVEAFTLSDDHARQLEVWKTVSQQYHFSSHGIRRMLTEKSYSANSRLGRFVGIDAYREAGGVVIEDLFSDHNNSHLEDTVLVERLATEKLEATAEDLRKTWKWAEARHEVAYEEFRHFGRVYPRHLDMDPEVAEELELLRQRAETLETDYDEETWTDGCRKKKIACCSGSSVTTLATPRVLSIRACALRSCEINRSSWRALSSSPSASVSRFTASTIPGRIASTCSQLASSIRFGMLRSPAPISTFPNEYPSRPRSYTSFG
ncbi:hypothetical protein [Chelativorans xinjiangense]|uniref:hypothetical protein n=1 Tax=Chelativorans xinjiangense TaxID=2681485 RepID=UPI001358ECE7|nr:hypothetical protein [Chelativorans xinjiangense]